MSRPKKMRYFHPNGVETSRKEWQALKPTIKPEREIFFAPSSSAVVIFSGFEPEADIRSPENYRLWNVRFHRPLDYGQQGPVRFDETLSKSFATKEKAIEYLELVMRKQFDIHLAQPELPPPTWDQVRTEGAEVGSW